MQKQVQAFCQIEIYSYYDYINNLFAVNASVYLKQSNRPLNRIHRHKTMALSPPPPPHTSLNCPKEVLTVEELSRLTFWYFFRSWSNSLMKFYLLHLNISV